VKGKTLGSRYKIIKYIAKGGFGKTYLAEDTQLPGKDQCVVKQLYPSIEDPEFLATARRLFKTEAATLHNLGHYNQIPKLLAYFEEEEKFYLVQQYIEGHTLATELTPGQVWSETKVIELLADGLNILGFIHSQGVIHRDVKPDNLIRRNSDGKLVLVDFGTVKEVLQEQTQIGRCTVAVGTQGYMSTEQARGKPRLTSDLYALGVIGIQAITGIPPLALHEDDQGELIWQSIADVSDELAGILTKMTRYHFKDRYQSAEEALQVLQALYGNVATDSQSTTLKYTTTKLQLNSSGSTNLSDETSTSSSSSPIDKPRGQNAIASKLETPPATKVSLVPGINSQTSPTKKNSGKSKVFTACGIAIAIAGAVTGGMYFFNQSSAKVDNLILLHGDKKFTECQEKARAIITDKANNSLLINQGKEFEVKCGLGLAQNQAELTQFAAALAIAKELPTGTPVDAELQQQIDNWSEKILLQAEELYENQGELQAAIKIAQQIPQDATIKQKALDAQAAWETEVKTNQEIIAAAQKALNESKWDDAQQEIAKIDGSTSVYWQQEAKTVAENIENAIANAAQNAQPETPPIIIPSQPDPPVTPKPKNSVTPKQEISPPVKTPTKRVNQGSGFREDL